MGEECSMDVLKLEHDPPEDFGLCVCQEPGDASGSYYFIRDAFVTCHFLLLVWEVVLSLLKKELKLQIFFDFWTQVLVFFSAEMGFFGPARNFQYIRDCDDDYWDCMPWYCKAHWALFSAALPSSVLSCVVFWSQVYKKNINILPIVLNTVSPFLVVSEFILISFPLRLLNFFYFIIFYVIYISFTVVYWKCGGTGVQGSASIYKLLDWRHPERAFFTAFVGLSIGVGVYLIFCFLSMAKLACKNRGYYE